MNAQALDLRALFDAMRRQFRLVLAIVLLGGALGAGLILLRPPSYSSLSQVLLPPPARDGSGETTQRAVDTYVQVTTSAAVLAPVIKDLKLDNKDTAVLAKRLRVSAPTADVIQIVARAGDAREAQALAQATAVSLIDYLQNPVTSTSGVSREELDQEIADLRQTSDEVRAQIRATKARIRTDPPGSAAFTDAVNLSTLTARQADLVLRLSQTTASRDAQPNSNGGVPGVAASLIQPALRAARYSLVHRYVLSTGAGVLIGLLVATIWVGVRTRRDRRLYTRDGLADALGCSVVASIASSAPSTPAAWLDLMSVYDPPDVDAWAIRQALHQAKGTILVISLSDDVRGLALAPLVAAAAAANGTSTRLVPVQSHDSATTLWAACARASAEGSSRPGLQVELAGAASAVSAGAADTLTVLVAVADRSDPRLDAVISATAASGTTTLLAVSAGNATLEELARVAVRADEAGRAIEGILLADPERLDRTTGRLSMGERAQQVTLPIRLTGAPPRRDPDAPTGSVRRGLMAVSDTTRIGPTQQPS